MNTLIDDVDTVSAHTSDDTESERAFKENEFDVLRWYNSCVLRFSLLSPEEEAELGRRIRDHHDMEARNTLVEHNLRLVRWIATRYAWSALPFEDLLQEGNIGLMMAADKYDPAQGRFIAFASYDIRREILKLIFNQSHPIRIPLHVLKIQRKINHATQELESELKREPRINEVAARLDIDERVIRDTLLLIAGTNTGSLDEIIPSNDGASNLTQGDVLRDNNSFSPEQILEAKEAFAATRQTMDAILHVVSTHHSPFASRNAEIFKMFYGLEESAHLAPEAIAREFNISRQCVDQIIGRLWVNVKKAGIAMDQKNFRSELARIEELEKLIAR